MAVVEPSVIALIVTDDRRAALFTRSCQELLDEHTKPHLPRKLSLERFRSVGEFVKAQRERKNLSGTVIDMNLGLEASEAEKRALQLFEELQIPNLRLSERMADGDAVDRKILLGKWNHFVEQIEAFAPRGLRQHPRKPCYVKIRYHEIGEAGAKAARHARPPEARAITFDISFGGCFIVSPEDWGSVERLSIFVGDHPEPVECRIAWRLPWGSTHWKMPGIGVEFLNIDAKLRLYLQSYLQDA